MLVNRNFKIVWVAENYGTGVNSPVVCDTTVQYIGNQVVIKFNTPTGTRNPNNDQTRFTVYPNPATNKVTISFNAETTDNAKIKLTDYAGKCVYRKTVNVNVGANTYTLNTKQNNINCGAYFVSITCDSKMYNKKLLIQ